RAVSGANVELIKLLLLKGAMINACDKEKKTPLIKMFQYADSYDPSFVKVLSILLNNSDLAIDQQDGSGKTALMYMAEKIRHDTKIMQALIDKGPNVTVQDNEGQTVLHKAATCGNYGILEVLMSG